MSEPSLTREELPDGAIRLSFSEAILDGAEPKKTLVIRRPSIGEQMRLGDPLTWVVDEKASMPIVNRALVEEYCRILITGHDWDFISRATNMPLAIAIEEAILGFFRSARITLKG
jgi:hypothetical protein